MAQTFHRYRAGDKPVGGYKLIRKLGEGGFGEVWQASAPGGAEVALKFIDLTGQQGFREFKSLRLVKKITHNNLTPLHGFWLKTEDGTLIDESDSTWSQAVPTFPIDPSSRPGQNLATAVFTQPVELIVAMGLGKQSLYDRLRDCQQEGLAGIPADELLDYMRDAAKGIDYLNKPRHDLGSGLVPIVHSDIKPHNILIVGDGAQVCDFGLAQAVESLRKTCAAPLTLAYAAPESFRGKPCDKSDQYSLAITYIELRTGCLPFDDSLTGYEVMTAHVQGQLDFSRLTPGEAAVIRRATAIMPQDRWETSRQMVEELRKSLRLSSDSGFAPDLGTSGPIPLPPALPGIATTPTAGLTMMPPGMPARETSVHAGLTPSDVDPALKTRTPGVAPIIVPAPPQVEPAPPRRRMSTGAKLLVSLVLLGLVGGGAGVGYVLSNREPPKKLPEVVIGGGNGTSPVKPPITPNTKKDDLPPIVTPPVVTPPIETGDPLEDARKAFAAYRDSKQYQKAIETLMATPAAFQGNEREQIKAAWRKDADEHFINGRYPAAARTYADFAKTFSENAALFDYKLMHARAHLGAEEVESARAMLKDLTAPEKRESAPEKLYFLVKHLTDHNTDDSVNLVDQLYTVWKEQVGAKQPVAATLDEQKLWTATEYELEQFADARDSIIRRWLESADSHRNKPTSVNDLAKIVEMDPKNVDAWLAKADAHLEHNQLADAVAAMQTRKALGNVPKILAIELRAPVLEAYFELTDEKTNDARLAVVLKNIPSLLSKSAIQDRRIALATAVSQLADRRAEFLSQAVERLRPEAESSGAPDSLKRIFADLLTREIPQRLARESNFPEVADELLKDCRFVAQLASTPEDVPESVRACHAECLLELGLGDPAAALGNSGTIPYYHFVRARVLASQSGNRQEIDNSLRQLFAKQPQALMSFADRSKKAIALVDAVADQVRGVPMQFKIQQVLTLPVGEESPAQETFKLLQSAYTWVQPTALSADSLANLAVGAWWMKGSESNPALAKQVSHELVRDWLANKSNETRQARLAFSLYHTFLAAHQNDNDPSIENLRIDSAVRLIDLCGSTEMDARDAALFYQNVVQPIEELAEKHRKHEFFDEAARLVSLHPKFDWKFRASAKGAVTVADKLEELYTLAIEASEKKVGQYFKARADARLKRQPPDFALILEDAAELKRFKPFEGQGFATEGNVLFLQSRAQKTLPDRYKYLNLALKALQTAESLSEGEGQLSQNGLDHARLLLSMAHLERGNFAGLFASDNDGYKIVPKQEFQKAIDYAQSVIKRGGGPSLQYAYQAAANAYEDLAWHAREMATANFAEAVKYLRYSVALDEKSADARVALARCYYKMVVETRVNPPELNSNFAEHLDAAEVALKNAIVLEGDQKDPEMHLWLGKVIQASHVDERTTLEPAKQLLTADEYREADVQFTKAFDAAKEANMSRAYLATYALARAEHALLNPSIKLKTVNVSKLAINDIYVRANDLAALKDATTVRLDPLQESLILKAKADLHTKTPLEVIESLQPQADALAKTPVEKLTRSDVKLMEFRLGLQSPLRPDQLTKEVVESAVDDALWYSTTPAALVAADRVAALVTAVKFNRQIVVNDKAYLSKSLDNRVDCLKKLAALPVKDDLPLHQFIAYEANDAVKSATSTPAVAQALRAAGKAYMEKAVALATANKRPAAEIEQLNKLVGLFK